MKALARALTPPPLRTFSLVGLGGHHASWDLRSFVAGGHRIVGVCGDLPTA